MATQNQTLQEYYSRIANSSDLEAVMNDSMAFLQMTNLDLFNQISSAAPSQKRAALTAFINAIRSGNSAEAELNAKQTLSASNLPKANLTVPDKTTGAPKAGAEAYKVGPTDLEGYESGNNLSSTGLMSTGLDMSNFGHTLSGFPGTLGLVGAGFEAAGGGLVGLASKGMVGFADPAAGGFPSQAEANAIAAENAGIGGVTAGDSDGDDGDGSSGVGGAGVGAAGGTGTGSAGEGPGWAKGGKVTKNRLKGPNPKGPDDGYGALDHGEYVIKAAVVKNIGEAKLRALNDGRADIVIRKK